MSLVREAGNHGVVASRASSTTPLDTSATRSGAAEADGTLAAGSASARTAAAKRRRIGVVNSNSKPVL